MHTSRFGNCVWSKMVPLLLIWPTFYNTLRPPATETPLWRPEGDSTNGGVPHTAVGTHAECIPVLHRVPPRQQNAECRCPQPATPTRTGPCANPRRGAAVTRLLGHSLPGNSRADPAVDRERSNTLTCSQIRAEGLAKPRR